MLLHEREAWSQGYLTLAGVDEAGRGPLAGPVVAAAVVIPRDVLEAEHTRLFSGIADSKTLTAKRREALFARLSEETSVARGIGLADVAEIDSLNILRATHLAMKRAVEALDRAVDMILVDGRPVPGLPFASRAIVKGDAQSLLIAAASIVAKVTRDHLMDELDRQYPRYGFARHKGYGTAEHLAALREWGPTPVHRRSFAPVAAARRLC
ncbi:MAG: ribonuclease HII [Kiritimatiellae bacterium]|nr:ribonuclease HII [Kiritimatiellia bacterium]MCO5062750.1 ribonuclease HII [Kiritimatiellia bacterium]MCO5067095.1 ribonuclease HII [Kiritimatiellia bacterium]MCO6401256.1 ribonuclease HII [Verrucomicrobiota bacterium]